MVSIDDQSNLTQWKRAGLITLKSLDRNQELLSFCLLPFGVSLLGWGCLIVAAGASYWGARRHIDARRAMQEAQGQRPSEKLDWRSRIEQHDKQSAAATATTAAAPPSPPPSPAVRDGTQAVEKGPS
ncbi:hypothetical protein BD414DRAFT_509556 [Trametes punicea]|nr:hypothetical protein BD414DRAFT_509556 [Trametes punicea]